MVGICLTHSEVGKKIWDYKRDCNWCLLFAVWHRQCQYVDRPHVYDMAGKLTWTCLVGAPLSGWISDIVIIRSQRKRGFWYPEDRLRATLFGTFLPIAVILSAVITRYIPGTYGLILNLFCLFFTGVAVSILNTSLRVTSFTPFRLILS